MFSFPTAKSSQTLKKPVLTRVATNSATICLDESLCSRQDTTGRGDSCAQYVSCSWLCPPGYGAQYHKMPQAPGAKSHSIYPCTS